MADKSAMRVVEIHYSSLPFGSKNEGYWDVGARPDMFRAHLFKWCALCGIVKDMMPDGLEISLIKESLLTSFPYMNENSITDALHKNLAGEFEKRVEMYNKFNAKYLYEVLHQYDVYLRKAHKIAVDAKNKLNEPAPAPELTDEQKQSIVRDGILEAFSSFKLSGDLNLISNVEYDYLTKTCGISIVTDARKRELMVEAKAQLTVMLGQGSIAKGFAELQKELHGGTDQQIIAMAKKLAVRDYYQTIEKLEI